MKITSLIPAIAIVFLTGLSVVAWAHDGKHSGTDHADGKAKADGHMKNLVVALPGGLTVRNPVLLVAGPTARSVAAYLVIENASEVADRLIGAQAAFADNTGLHRHIMDGDIAKMRAVEDGFEIPPGGRHELARGGDHIMIMGLKTVPAVGDAVYLTLTFENAGSFTIPFAVMPAVPGGAMQHDTQ